MATHSRKSPDNDTSAFLSIKITNEDFEELSVTESLILHAFFKTKYTMANHFTLASKNLNKPLCIALTYETSISRSTCNASVRA